MRFGLLLALPLAAALGGAAACLIDLDPPRDCGDGYVDTLAGEDCEPGLPDSYAGRCEELGQVARPAACAADTCTFNPAGCGRCGNGVVDAGEQCDPADMNQPTCPGEGVATCRDDCTIDDSGCPPCGNGVIDIDEECDKAADNSGAMVDCRDLISPGGIARRYGSGHATDCTSACKWNRSLCSYCGNDRLESDDVMGVFVDFEGDITPPPEVCDNDQADRDKLVDFCQQTEVCGGNFRVECSAGCAPGCLDFTAPPDGDASCCTARGEDCPYNQNPPFDLKDETRAPCCRQFTHPDEPVEKLCDTVTIGEDPVVIRRLCR